MENLDACRWLYNRLLQDLNEAKEKDIKLRTYDTQNMIPSMKLENPKLNLVYSKVLQMVNYTLWSNFKGLAASKMNGRKIGHVRFKGYGWYNTMNYNQSSFDIICVEDLDVIGLKEKGHNNGMHRSIHDASWSKFIFMLSYKARSAGRKLIKIDPKNTTQRCSACGSIVKKDLSVRVHECPYCGFSCDRDYNASRNILITGMEQPVAPIELKPLHHITVMQVLAMKWEAAPFRTR